jgi:myo-inositol-1-phosphate synthase
MPSAKQIQVNSPNVQYTDESIISSYEYQTTVVDVDAAGTARVTPVQQPITFKTARQLPRMGVMLVGLGGNNGSTVVASTIANRLGLTWETRRGTQKPNYFGSITQSSTIRLGQTKRHDEIHMPLKAIVPLVDPNDIVFGGWDCSSMNLYEALRRAQVLEPDLIRQLRPHMEGMKPLPAIWDLEFVAANQDARADNIITGTKAEAVEVVRKNIRDFKASNNLDTVIVLWTANTERFSELKEGVHDTADNLLQAVQNGEAELAPSACYAMAAILEGCSYINGAPQNTFVPGLVELAERHRVFIGGDDFKSGQTKMKSALIEFFVGAGIKPECIASYNHLGNNDGRNLNAPKQFRSKEITKSNVVDDMVASNNILFPEGSSKPDHCIVIKYLPYVGDSKRAMDEYAFQIFMGGQQTVVMHNTCEDSLLAAPLILDLCILTELSQRLEISTDGGKTFERMRSVLSILSYLLKAPFVPAGTPVINALNRQKQAIENLFRAMVGLPAENNMLLECRMRQEMKTA